jgi:hypothetical protein
MQRVRFPLTVSTILQASKVRFNEMPRKREFPWNDKAAGQYSSGTRMWRKLE